MKTLVDQLDDSLTRQFHAGRGLQLVLEGLQRRDIASMRMGAIILHEVHREVLRCNENLN